MTFVREVATAYEADVIVAVLDHQEAMQPDAIVFRLRSDDPLARSGASQQELQWLFEKPDQPFNRPLKVFFVKPTEPHNIAIRFAEHVKSTGRWFNETHPLRFRLIRTDG